jgi:hypothetical protein
MSPVVRKTLDVAVATALTAAVVFIIVVSNNFLVARGSPAYGFNLWYAFIGRPDILGTMVLTAAVTLLYLLWQQGRRPGI